MSSKDSDVPADGPLTLAFDIGGSHLKAGVLSTAGQMITDRVRIVTPHPAEPEKLVEGLMGLAQQLGNFDRITIGFPGVVRSDTVLTAPHLVTRLCRPFVPDGKVVRHRGR